jgi:hypothetical protein
LRDGIVRLARAIQGIAGRMRPRVLATAEGH